VETSRNPFLDHIHLAPTQSISDSALYTHKQKSSEDENELILRLKQENNALKDENQSLRYSSSYVTNSDRDQKSERLRLELNQLEGDKSPRNTTNSTINCTPSSVMAHPISFQQSLPVVPPRMNLTSIPQNSRDVFQTSRPNVSFDSSRNDGRRTRVPCYNGKEPWSAYQMQFELISEHNNWTASVKAIELLTALKDDAMVYASFLPSDVKSSFSSLCAAMVSRFGDHGYPETTHKNSIH